MKKYIKASSWCQDSEGNVIYEGDMIRDPEGWEFVVDKIYDDGSVCLTLIDEGIRYETFDEEYSVNDIKKEFIQV